MESGTILMQRSLVSEVLPSTLCSLMLMGSNCIDFTEAGNMVYIHYSTVENKVIDETDLQDTQPIPITYLLNETDPYYNADVTLPELTYYGGGSECSPDIS
jgi:hypothetical protein